VANQYERSTTIYNNNSRKKAGSSLDLTHMQLGSGNKAPTGSEVALITPTESALISSGFKVSTTQIRMSAIFNGGASYVAREVGIWAGDPDSGGILFGYWSQESGDLTTKSAGVDLILSHDMVLYDVVGSENVTIAVDSAQAAMILDHEIALDPHTQYLKEADAVTQSAAEAGTETTVRAWSALRVKQAISKFIAAHVSLSDPHTQYLKKTGLTKSAIDALNVDADKLDGLDSSQFARADTNNVISGNSAFHSMDNTGGYASAAIELREANLVSNTQTAAQYAPAVTFHWGGLAQTQLALNADGVLHLRDGSTHSTLRNLAVGDIYIGGTWYKDNTLVLKSSLSVVNLDDFLTTGMYHQSSNSNAAASPNSPDVHAGMLEVVNSGSMTFQRYTVYSTGVIYTRCRYISTWPAWQRQWNSGNDGTGSGLDADKLRGLYPSTNASANTIVQRNAEYDIDARLFTSTYQTQGQPNSSADFCFRQDNVSDRYLRFTDRNGLLGYLNLSGTMASSGYQRLPSGMIMQWMKINSVAGDSNTGKYTFPIAFPSTAVNIQLQFEGTYVNDDAYLGVYSMDKLGFYIGNGLNHTRNIYVFAIGY